MQLNRTQLALPLGICFLCQAMAGAFSVPAIAHTAREGFFGGLCAAVAGALLVLFSLCLGMGFAALATGGLCKNVASLLLCIGLLFGVGQTLMQQLRFYQMMFGTGGAWVLLLGVAAALLHATPHAMVRCAKVLCVFCGVAALCAAVGLLAQSNVHRLASTPLSAKGVCAAFGGQSGLFPEYLLLIACPPDPKVCDTKKAGSQGVVTLCLLPLLASAVQFLAVLCTELLFGVQQAGVGGFEFLRSWALLSLSRYDGVVVLLWLLLALFRLRLFAFVAVQVYPFSVGRLSKRNGEECA